MSAISTPRSQTTLGGASATFAGRRPRRRENHTRPRVAPRLITLALLLVPALLISISGLRSVTNHIRHINPMWLAVAIALELASDLSSPPPPRNGSSAARAGCSS
jgi:hypothetical protein